MLCLNKESFFEGWNTVTLQDGSLLTDGGAGVLSEGIPRQETCILCPVQALANCIEIRRDGLRIVICPRKRIVCCFTDKVVVEQCIVNVVLRCGKRDIRRAGTGIFLGDVFVHRHDLRLICGPPLLQCRRTIAVENIRIVCHRKVEVFIVLGVVESPDECFPRADRSRLEGVACIEVLIVDGSRGVHLHLLGLVLFIFSQQSSAVCGGRDIIHSLHDSRLLCHACTACFCRSQLLIEIHIIIRLCDRGRCIECTSKCRAV